MGEVYLKNEHKEDFLGRTKHAEAEVRAHMGALAKHPVAHTPSVRARIGQLRVGVSIDKRSMIAPPERKPHQTQSATPELNNECPPNLILRQTRQSSRNK
ncbi:hypothetical protein F442_13002 [Phytophthora nicotianae P10297]|uniref:Uncharacterized protein n=1 Tax=Phytophthora nicotianae P10297 TaxID=1317064 RepID=W2YWY3_PHYNI|nr:hypothetical protein F442_13002 [Phytophthora nicotianae P10297]